MEVVEVTKERLRFASKGFTSIMVTFFIALPVLLIFSMMSGNSKFDPSLFFLGVDEAQNATAALEYKPASFKRTIAPLFIGGHVSKDEFFEPTLMRNDDLLNATSSHSNGEKSGSFQSTRTADNLLLDGLIPFGFDESSCLSRYHSVRYRRISPHKPSPFLLAKLRNYEKLHARCGPNTESYNKTLKGLTESHTSIPTVCKYVIWRPVNGLGNRMISIVSSFLYAILTNRVLLVYNGTDMANLFCEPFPSTSWLLPRDFPLRNQLHKSEMKYSHTSEGIQDKDRINKLIESAPTPLFLHLALKKRDYLDKKFFFCDQGQAFLRKVPWLVLSSEQYFAPSFFLMPSFQKEVSRMFLNKETVFHHLGRYLFSPSNQVWEQLITKFYDAYLVKADEKIGLQIRVFRANAKMLQITMDKVLACTLKAKLIPEVDTAASNSKSRKSSKAIVVTSLRSEFYNNLSNMYLDKPTVTGEVVSVYQPSHEGYQHRGDNMHNMKAWAEIYLLSLCDVLVTSPWSTFGYVAQGLGGLKPWILQQPENGMYQACKQAMSMEPCFHYPSRYDCKSENKIDVGSLVPYIRKCEDRESGVKLFNDH
ncbi:galactoside 2-alpha-L-fucosyltransferase-like [Euphorbia lathyris]|uniref:galactoside 2-alpha-L-fucosyltransferase-like n=1 Tax=Euphorbia lathyris TaxID=212925 RepID=UPI003313C892